jgi:hypothetical protein
MFYQEIFLQNFPFSKSQLTTFHPCFQTIKFPRKKRHISTFPSEYKNHVQFGKSNKMKAFQEVIQKLSSNNSKAHFQPFLQTYLCKFIWLFLFLIRHVLTTLTVKRKIKKIVNNEKFPCIIISFFDKLFEKI